MGDSASGNPSTHRHTYAIDRNSRVVHVDQAAQRALGCGQAGPLSEE